MIAVDTNVLARFLLNDHPGQTRRAVAFLESGQDVWIPVTVLLELAWVLKARGVPAMEGARALRALIALPHVRVQLADTVTLALGWVDSGIDVADALHLALSDKADRFATFDRTLISRAKRLSIEPQVVPA